MFGREKNEKQHASTRLAAALLRVPTGLFILNSGAGKLGADEGTAEFLHGMAQTGIPALKLSLIHI